MRRRLLLSLGLAAAACTLAGCGGSSDPLGAVLSAARSTLSQNAQLTLTLRGAAVLGGAPAAVVAKGAFAFPAGLGYEAVQVPAARGRAPGTSYLVFRPAEVDVDPPVHTALPRGRLWIAAAFPRSGAPDPRWPGLAEGLEGLSPQLLVEEIAWGATAASSLGQRVIDHVPSTEYAVSVDLERALAAASGPAAGAMRPAIREELAALRTGRSSPSLRIAVWVDGPGRIARLQATVPGSGLGTVSMSLSGFGVGIPASLPAAAQTVAVGSLSPPAGMPPAGWVLTGGH